MFVNFKIVSIFKNLFKWFELLYLFELCYTHPYLCENVTIKSFRKTRSKFLHLRILVRLDPVLGAQPNEVDYWQLLVSKNILTSGLMNILY